MAKAKVQITIDDDLLLKVDEYADDHYMNRSSVFTLGVTQIVNAEIVTKAIKSMAVSMRKIADSGQIDDETRQQLEDFERVCSLMYGKA